ncbi:PIN domain-containing protein [Nostoc sp. JL33]|uniref:PIN domain-containing protein n=1 Tax=Nostoc sp. JL33 TaxID=2815396 RepID=UPI0025DEA92B|nr:PIN domain-containing protein [Nostoc sp. JL33]MBN3870004.1 PIN domain-containing protein [Nostoc sp. JL33]
MQIAEVLLPLVVAEGILLDDLEQVTAALKRMANANVDFIDAYLAETPHQKGETIVSFDRDFKRL